MAYFQRRKGAVYLYEKQSGLTRQLPRSLSRHLDQLSNEEVRAWVYSNPSIFSMNPQLDARQLTGAAETDRLKADYCTYLSNHLRRTYKTVWEHRYCLENFIFPYFSEKAGVMTPFGKWPETSSDFCIALSRSGVSQANQRKAAMVLRCFYRYLGEERIVKNPKELLVRIPARLQKNTPLRKTITPQDVLAFAAESKSQEMRLLAMIGFFFSLRTFELLALRPIDFLGPPQSTSTEASKAMFSAELFDKLVVRVHRQRNAKGEFIPPKRNSSGFVACFNQDAAKAIANAINSIEPNSLLFPHLPDSTIARWHLNGIPNITLKDLRRASIYWLGHYSSLSIAALKNHARHSSVDTTLLYCRRPEEQPLGWTPIRF